ncbi:MAG: hypothetical protein COZ17_06420 [Flavobacteriaceae bacterium CG_4_10_14_3_um_filter_33_47]|nr:MAG: hypothetical protein COW44_11200 [Flavobacteriaceae bacterium CG17_big_fil_post_rev_8_21_14_2_50_33_15]PIY11542.1 MAG: hypothetical protein COZ17_06420 [Flavobacteriaceae bacterium CG_4_10_14_3_um_filter_33_47]PJB18849.1 MAG: hypothetical protein CO117_06895 [Flavobacteriaceae bacterium CG_4_9_14_3_um_filter_33_16]
MNFLHLKKITILHVVTENTQVILTLTMAELMSYEFTKFIYVNNDFLLKKCIFVTNLYFEFYL